MSDEKTEDPTEHKLRKSREDGQMAKSQDAPIAASMLACVITLVAMADDIARRLQIILSQAIDMRLGDIPLDEIFKRMGTMFIEAIIILLPIVIAASLGAAIGMAAHVGLQISPKALAPKFDSINPAQGIKNIISLKSLLTFLLMLVKAIVIAVVVWQVIISLLPLLAGAIYQSPARIAAISWISSKKLLFAALGIFVVVAPVDYMIQKRLFIKGQRMSKDEVKREFKSLEGDPMIKGQRKQIAREIAEGDPREALAKADALIVNPTHFAVGVRYRNVEEGVPIILVKGVDEKALALRELAAELQVPIHSNPPLARALYVVPLRKPIPDELFEAVAEVLKWVEEQKAGKPASDASSTSGHIEQSVVRQIQEISGGSSELPADIGQDGMQHPPRQIR